jgi:hypothetical protein
LCSKDITPEGTGCTNRMNHRQIRFGKDGFSFEEKPEIRFGVNVID